MFIIEYFHVLGLQCAALLLLFFYTSESYTDFMTWEPLYLLLSSLCFG